MAESEWYLMNPDDLSWAPTCTDHEYVWESTLEEWWRRAARWRRDFEAGYVTWEQFRELAHGGG